MILRLLPWTGPEGKPCYLSSGDERSYLADLADDLEAVQLAAAEDLLEYVGKALSAGTVSEFELRLMVSRLSQALRDTLRVADSRGARTPAPYDEDDSPPPDGTVSREEVASEIAG